jgi:hypothetical protein
MAFEWYRRFSLLIMTITYVNFVTLYEQQVFMTNIRLLHLYVWENMKDVYTIDWGVRLHFPQ